MQPEMLACCRRICADATPDLDFFRLPRDLFLTLPSVSFDVAFMERLQGQGAVVSIDIGWSDIGSWDSIKEVLAEGDGGNVTRGAVELFDCSNVLALSDGPLIVGHRLTDALIVASQDAVYIAPGGESNNVRGIVAQLEQRGRIEATRHKREFRPWGWYQTINFGERFRVKEIVVNPGGKLSLQSHQHRAEHWVVVRGAATVTIEDKTTLIAENQSVYIPLGSKHRLENAGKIPMHLIEVQTGSYLEEDDIVRYEDQYGR
jgi:mannose-1-phosphate guanylyltransferase/mannose-6-phosphate isomerase